jgi:hypothetical protein
VADFDYDLFVIGAGSGGVRAARIAAMSGAKVAVAEEHRVGGTCVIRGCVPKKFMVYASEYSKHFESARGYGWSVPDPVFDWPRFLRAKDDEIARLSGIYVRNLQNAGAELVHGRARLKDRHTVEVEGHGAVTAEEDPGRHRRRPWMPQELPGIEHAITLQRGLPPARAARSASWSPAAAISRWSSPASSTASASRPPGAPRPQRAARLRRRHPQPHRRGDGGARIKIRLGAQIGASRRPPTAWSAPASTATASRPTR